MKKIFIWSLLIYLASNLYSSITCIWPKTMVNDTVITLHVHGGGFFDGITNIKFYKDGYPDITASNINVIQDNYLTCEFDLDNRYVTSYSLLIEKSTSDDSLRLCFTCNKKNISINTWNSIFGNGFWKDDYTSIGFGDPDGDNVNELYIKGTYGQGKLLKINYDNIWILDTIIYIYEDIGTKLIIIDGDNDGYQEIYRNYYQLKFIGGNWILDDSVFSISGGFILTAGDADNDGLNEFYGVVNESSGLYRSYLYRIRFDSSSWNTVLIDTFETNINAGLIGDGDNDGYLELMINQGYNLLTLEWNDGAYTIDTVGRNNATINRIALCDFDLNGELEIYCKGNNFSPFLYYFYRSGNNWTKDSLTFPYSLNINSIVAADGDNDGIEELFFNDNLQKIYSYDQENGLVYITQLGEDYIGGLCICDGNNNGVLDIFSMSVTPPDPYNVPYWQAVVNGYETPIIDTTLVYKDQDIPFHTIEPNDTTSEQLKIINYWSYDIDLDSFFITDTNVFSFQVNYPCTIGNYDSIIADILFTPVDTGHYYDTLVFYTSDTLQPIHRTFLSANCSYNTGIEEEISNPNEFSYHLSYSERGEVSFILSVPSRSQINLSIYDLSGRLVDTPISGILSPGSHQIPFRSERSGIYFYRLESSSGTESGKFMVVR